MFHVNTAGCSANLLFTYASSSTYSLLEKIILFTVFIAQAVIYTQIGMTHDRDTSLIRWLCLSFRLDQGSPDFPDKGSVYCSSDF